MYIFSVVHLRIRQLSNGKKHKCKQVLKRNETELFVDFVIKENPISITAKIKRDYQLYTCVLYNRPNQRAGWRWIAFQGLRALNAWRNRNQQNMFA